MKYYWHDRARHPLDAATTELPHRARNQSSHTYSDKVRLAIGQDILARFHPAFQAMEARFQAILNKETGTA